MLKFFRNRGLVFKQTFLIMLAVILIAGGVLWVIRFQALNSLTGALKAQAGQLSLGAVREMDQTFLESMRIGEMLALRLSEGPVDEAGLERLMRDVLALAHRARPAIVALAVAYEPGAFGSPAGAERMRLAEWKAGTARILNGENYRDKSWYARTREMGKGNWCEPFIGEFVREPIAIYSVPFYETQSDGVRRFAGVACVDLSLAWLSEVVARLKIEDSGYAFILSNSGRVVTHPDAALVFNETMNSLAEKRGDGELKKTGEAMVRGENGIARYWDWRRNRPAWIYYMPMTSNGWSLGVVFPAKELFGLVSQLSGTLLWLGGCGLLLLILGIVLISIRISRPLTALAHAAREIGDGKFDTELPVLAGGDELAVLAGAFRQMRDSLDEHIENLKQVTAAKEKIESELKVAQEIQNGILPKILPPFPKCDFFEIDAFLHPAREVGGDLYDFFLLGPNRVGLVIGDVSGKGVPASLFMAVTQTLHRGLAHGEVDPAVLVTKMNKALCNHNDALMFVTYIFAVLELDSGKLTFCNAGHNPFYILRAAGGVEKIADRHGIPLGVMEDSIYRGSVQVLAPGDMLVFYTDGVTEAVNAQDELFGDARLLGLLEEENALHPEPWKLDEVILRAVRKFAGSREQIDDITVLSLRLSENDGQARHLELDQSRI